MDEKIDKAIEVLLVHMGKPGSPPKADESLKFSQAALNLAHAKQILNADYMSRGKLK
jgi:hypothetical protein